MVSVAVVMVHYFKLSLTSVQETVIFVNLTLVATIDDRILESSP